MEHYEYLFTTSQELLKLFARTMLESFRGNIKKGKHFARKLAKSCKTPLASKFAVDSPTPDVEALNHYFQSILIEHRLSFSKRYELCLSFCKAVDFLPNIITFLSENLTTDEWILLFHLHTWNKDYTRTVNFPSHKPHPLYTEISEEKNILEAFFDKYYLPRDLKLNSLAEWMKKKRKCLFPESVTFSHYEFFNPSGKLKSFLESKNVKVVDTRVL